MKTIKLFIVLLCLAGISKADSPPQFSLLWSEYPSWSTFGVANDLKLIDGDAGKLGEIEKKYGVDIVLKLAEYDPCLTMYAANQADAVCATNVDILNIALKRPSVAILATSTSYGADAVLVTPDIKTVEDLQKYPIYGLPKTVSEYMVARNIEIKGLNPADFPLVNMDPGVAAIAMQQKKNDQKAIVVWNPFVLQTLNQRKDVKVLFDSTQIKGEIIDMVVMSEDSLKRPGADNAAKAICEAFYQINKRIEHPSTQDDTLIALGEKFSSLTLQNMRQVVRQTVFYKTPSDGTTLFTSADLPQTMQKVVNTCAKLEFLPKDQIPVIGFGNNYQTKTHLRFDPQYMQSLK